MPACEDPRIEDIIRQSAKAIFVKIVNQYGEERIVPHCEEAKLFAAIAGTKTLTKVTVENIKLLGYTVRIAQDDRVAL
jgi:hypothetical protein